MYFGQKFLPDVRDYVYYVLAEIWATDSSHKIGNKFFIHHCQAERKVRLCVKLFDFFRRWILVHLAWNLSRCVPNSEDILTWNFRKKLFRENFSEILCKPRRYTKTCEISPYFLKSYSGFVFCWKKFRQVLSYVVCTKVRRHVHKRITKIRYARKKPRRFVFEKPVLFTLGLGLTAPYSLGILVWKFYQTFVIVSIEFRPRFEPQTRPKTFAINFLFITARAERKVHSCVKLFDFFPGWILIRLTWNLSRFVPNSVEILTRNFGKKTFWKNFSEILCKRRLSFSKTLEISPYFLKLYFGSVLRWKKLRRVLSYVVCTQVRRHVYKKITKRRYGGEKLGRFVFGNQFCSLSVWDLLRLTP